MLKKVYELYWTSTDQAMQHYRCRFANETSGSVETSAQTLQVRTTFSDTHHVPTSL
jgi:hypothetical protein